MRLYLDHNASSPLRPQARQAMLAAMDLVGNPSSVHAEGRAARKIVEDARRTIARAFGDEACLVTFTSGASEAAATLLTPGLQGASSASTSTLFVGAGEHPCVRAGGRFAPSDIDVVPLDGQGRIAVDALQSAIASRRGPVLVAIQTSNNETGVIQPIRDIGAVAKRHGAIFVADAVQSFGRVSLTDVCGEADAWFVSSHKIGGPKGVGAIVRPSQSLRWDPLVAGGGQEHYLRAGTENVAAIAGFAAAVEVAMQTLEGEAARLSALRDLIAGAVTEACPDVVVFGAGAPRLPNTLCFSVPGVTAETAMIALDLEGLAVSSGAACSSGKVKSSHVLEAMGVAPDLTSGALRISLGWSTEAAEIGLARAALDRVFGRLRRVSNAA